MIERLIFFDEAKHKYTDEYKNVYTSVTTGIHKYVTPFDSKKWSKIKAAEKNTSEKVILNQWDNIRDNSLDIGNTKHNHLEGSIKQASKFYKAVKIVTINNITRCFSVYDLAKYSSYGEMSLEAFYEKIGQRYPIIYKTIEFYVNKGFKIFAEINVYDPYNIISGTIDVLLVKDDMFVIIDWKTNRNEILFESGYYKKDKATNELTDVWVPKKSYLKYPLDNLEDCVGTHYTLQLSTYASMVEAFGYRCMALILFHIRDPYLLNKWGQPRKDERGMYIIDRAKSENINYHLIPYLREDANRMRNHIGLNKKINTQRQIIM